MRFHEKLSSCRVDALLAAIAMLGACAPAAPPPTTPAPAPATVSVTGITAMPPRAENRSTFRQFVDSLVSQPAFRNAHFGVLVVDPANGDTLYSHNAGKLFMPASNQKLITGPSATHRLFWVACFAAIW